MKRTKEEEEERGGAVVVSATSDYEQIREQRMKENAERMKKLGLLNLSLNLKLNKTPRPQIKKNPIPSDQSERRSSRYYYYYFYLQFLLPSSI
ncbi:hypothetical protein TSUD_95750 [Trifolium subterraneum]|uniref:Uncharacterized protein n=1 Tax=Trifolium subterraneum TaxID=3900 RepID=A0A2Z6NV36_TRISU|nr:hypothetical protein TSUD_95750 [Trifolium subterraneum]